MYVNSNKVNKNIYYIHCKLLNDINKLILKEEKTIYYYINSNKYISLLSISILEDKINNLNKIKKRLNFDKNIYNKNHLIIITLIKNELKYL